jgi:hypothetical protein
VSGHDITFAGGDHLLGPHLATRAGIGTYCVSGPIVHYAHHNYGRIAASIRHQAPRHRHGRCPRRRRFARRRRRQPRGRGAIGGAILGAFVDDVSLAWDWRPPPEPRPLGPRPDAAPPAPYDR